MTSRSLALVFFSILQILVGGDELKGLKTRDGRVLADDIALQVGKLGENLVARRGVAFAVSSDAGVVSCYAHPSSDSSTSRGSEEKFLFGRLGGLVALESSGRAVAGGDTGNVDLSLLGLQLCRHIVGEFEIFGADDK
jgi:translation elongation factor EF-Ts